METTTTTTTYTQRRSAAIYGLAVVGFIALIALGIVLAIYSARFVPAAANRVGSAAVYLSHIFEPANNNLTVVDQIPFASTTPATSTPATSTPVTASSTRPAASVPAATQPGPKTTTTYPAGGTAPATLYGQSDLTVSITQTGYLTNGNTDSFVGSPTVPVGTNPAVKFVVTNIGTNMSGQWSFNAVLPTSNTYIFNSNPQQSLRPGERIEYTLGFDQAQGGSHTITVTVDPSNLVSESNEANNSAASNITVQ